MQKKRGYKRPQRNRFCEVASLCASPALRENNTAWQNAATTWQKTAMPWQDAAMASGKYNSALRIFWAALRKKQLGT
ncbi:MAG: hypothetical protein ACI3YD_03280 [Alloprevotella sp.]